MKNTFEFKTYKTLLLDALGGGQKRTGKRTQAAEAIGCQTAYLSRVLNGDAHLSLEQALKAAQFLGFDSDEREFFLLLVQKDRAGTRDLETYFKAQIDRLLERRLSIKNRVGLKESLDPLDQTIYYSKWYYSCIHVILSMSGFGDRERIAEYLGLPVQTVSDVLEFLETRGLAVRDDKGQFKIGPRHIHLGEDSANIQKHHTNWRLQALASLDRNNKDDLHYSVVYTLSRKDAVKLKDRLIETIQANLKDVAPSPEEAIFCQTIDFFEI